MENAEARAGVADSHCEQVSVLGLHGGSVGSRREDDREGVVFRAGGVDSGQRRRPMTRILMLALCLLCAPALAQLQVVSTQPSLNARNVSAGAPISVTFDRPVNPATFTTQNFWA